MLRAVLGVLLLVAAAVLAEVALDLYDEGSPGDPPYPVAADVTGDTPNHADTEDDGPVGAIIPLISPPGYVRAEYVFSQREDDYRDLTIRFVADGNEPDCTPVCPPNVQDDEVFTIFRMHGGARVDPQSVVVDDPADDPDADPTNYVPSDRATVQDTPDGQYIVVSTVPRGADGPPGGDLTIRARMQRPVSATENSRTVLVTPRIYPPSICLPDGLQEIAQNLHDKSGLRAATENCSTPDTRDPFPQRGSRVDIAEPESFKVDYTNLPTRTPGLLSWTLDPDLDSLIGFSATSLVVNYVRIDQDALSARYLFTSAALIGVAAALAPIAFELLGTSRLRVAKRARRFLSRGPAAPPRASRRGPALGRRRRLTTSAPVRAPLPRRRGR